MIFITLGSIYILSIMNTCICACTLIFAHLWAHVLASRCIHCCLLNYFPPIVECFIFWGLFIQWNTIKCRGEKIFPSSLQGSLAGLELNWHKTDSQEKTNLILYIWEPQRYEAPSQAVVASMPSWAKEKWGGVWNFKGEEGNSQKAGKSKCLVNKYLPCHADKSSDANSYHW